MSPRPVRIVRSSLLKKGFVQIEDSNHQAFQLYVAGEKIGIRAYYSHSAKECDDFILGLMAKQLKISRAQLDNLIDCQMSGKTYVEILLKHGNIKT